MVALLPLVAALVHAAPTRAGTARVAFTPVADASVNRSHPYRNYGAASKLKARASGPRIRSYLRFSVRLPVGTEVERAMLKIYSRTTSARGYWVGAVDRNRWRERGITWSNAPAVSAPIASSGPLTAGTRSRVDVTSLVSDSGLVSFALTTDVRRTLVLSSRESTRKPRLSIRVSVPSSGSGPCGTASAPAAWQHVVWIVFENKTYSQIIGSSNAPYINSVANECGLATNFSAEAHPSLPNYIAMTSGSTQGITDDSGPSSHPLSVPSIFSQLGTGGWTSLEESMPSNCYLSDSGFYAVRHNPAAYYSNIRTDCSAQDVPLGSTPDISARFTFVTPNICHDMHSSSCGSDTTTEVKNGDAWLSGFLPKILQSSQYQAGTTAVFITWDEDDYSDSQHIPTIVISPSTPTGTTSDTGFNHYSMLRTTEELLGLATYLGNAASATSMRSAFHL